MGARKLSCLGAVVALLFGTHGQAQSLTELAKLEKERQAKARASGAPAKTYTDGAGQETTPSTESSGTFTAMSATSITPSTTGLPQIRMTPTPAVARPREVSRRDARSASGGT